MGTVNDQFTAAGLNIGYSPAAPGFGYGRSATAAEQPFANLVIHHTSNDHDLYWYVNYGHTVDAGRGGAFGYHFYIGRDGTIVQGAPLSVRTNHVLPPDHPGVSNRNSIGISLVGADAGATPAQIAAAEQLGRQVMQQFNIQPSHVFNHGELQPNDRAEEGHNAGLIEVVSSLRGGAQPAAPAPMAYTASQSTPAGQAAINAATGPGQDVTAPTPAPGSQRLFMPIRDAIAARQAGGTPRLDELRNIREQRMAGGHPLLERLRNFFQQIGHPAAQDAPTPPAPIPNRSGGGGGGSGGGSSSVAQIQRSLAAAGFDPGPIDGDMGPRTRAAVRQFQQANGLQVDGDPGPLTQAALARSVTGSVPLPRPRPGAAPVSGDGLIDRPASPIPAASSGMGTYNPRAPMDYGVPIAPQEPTPITAPAPGSLMAGTMTPSGPSGFGAYNPTANLNFGIPISPQGPSTVPAPSVNRNLGPMLAGYDTPGNGVGVPTTPVSRGVLPDAAPSWPQTAAGQTMWTDPAWRSSPGAGVGVAAPTTPVDRGGPLPPARPTADINIAGILAGLPQVAMSMPGWGASGGPTSGPGAGGRPVQVRATTTVPSQQWNIPGERERALDNGLMPAGRSGFGGYNGQFSYLPAFNNEPSPPLIPPNGMDGLARPVQSTSPPMDPTLPHRGIPVAEYWRRLLTGAGV